MKRLVTVVVLGLAGLLVAAFGVALYIDPAWQVERSVVISAPSAKVFPYINSLQRWPQWTAWNPTAYPGMTIRHEGPEFGVGAVQRWSDGDREGVITITESRPDTLMRYRLLMDDGAYALDGILLLTPHTAGTRVSWRVSGHSGANLVQRLLMLVYTPIIARDLETGLNTLKAGVERAPAATQSV